MGSLYKDILFKYLYDNIQFIKLWHIYITYILVLITKCLLIIIILFYFLNILIIYIDYKVTLYIFYLNKKITLYVFLFKNIIKQKTNKFINSSIFIIYSYFKKIFLSILLSLFIGIYLLLYLQIQLFKNLITWFIFCLLFFWLISTFNFFLKRYKFGKFTSAIQRFWKRTNAYFWIIETFLILIYFYYFLNSSQEPIYMYDYSSLNQEYLVSLNIISINIIILSIIIYLLYYILFKLNNISFNQVIILLMFIFFNFIYLFILETYQFIYLLNLFKENCKNFNHINNTWYITVNQPIFRNKLQYLSICLVAKYWHFLFIFISWIFFLIKSFEKKQVTITLLGYNIQNIIIFYFLNLLCYIQWFKWLYKRFFEKPYDWFFLNINFNLNTKLIVEIRLLLTNILNVNFKNITLLFKYNSFNIWNFNSIVIWKYI